MRTGNGEGPKRRLSGCSFARQWCTDQRRLSNVADALDARVNAHGYISDRGVLDAIREVEYDVTGEMLSCQQVQRIRSALCTRGLLLRAPTRITTLYEITALSA